MSYAEKRELLSNIVKRVDYDIWKGMFVSPEDPEEMAGIIDELIELIP